MKMSCIQGARAAQGASIAFAQNTMPPEDLGTSVCVAPLRHLGGEEQRSEGIQASWLFPAGETSSPGKI